MSEEGSTPSPEAAVVGDTSSREVNKQQEEGAATAAGGSGSVSDTKSELSTTESNCGGASGGRLGESVMLCLSDFFH